MLVALLTLLLFSGSGGEPVIGTLEVYQDMNYSGFLGEKTLESGEYESKLGLNRKKNKIVLVTGSGLNKKRIKFKIPKIQLEKQNEDEDYEMVLELHGDQNSLMADGIFSKVNDVQPEEYVEQACYRTKDNGKCIYGKNCGDDFKKGIQKINYQDTRVHYAGEMFIKNKGDSKVVAKYSRNRIRILRKIIKKSRCLF